ncbi:MAG TPA: MBL fold metallo-hydrolase [Vicinamibacteria bacterium]|nr:MBL fold metallo-hydrolase [Vicinamibacteria bacterium]
MKRLSIALALSLAGLPLGAAEPKAGDVKVTVLSTMLADLGNVGEWGFAAVVEVDGYRLLFDTGAREDTVLRNAEALKVDLSSVTDVLLSHNHPDHTGGLLKLRETLRAKNPAALSRAHVASGIFLSRRAPGRGDSEANRMLATRPAYEALGGRIVEHDKAEAVAPGVWLTGPVTRRHAGERNHPQGVSIVTPQGVVEDTVPEDMSLVIDGKDGLVVLTGCGHAGIGNILSQAREMVPGATVKAVLGGLHVYNAEEKTLAWTAEQMKQAGVRHLMGAHCTGIESLFRLRGLLGLDRATAVVGAVGASYSSAGGIEPGQIAK